MAARFLVLTNPVAGKEFAFHRWYEDYHLGEVAQVPGVTSATRHVAPPDGGARYVSCAIYEIQHDSPEDVVAEIVRRWEAGEMTKTDTMDDDIFMQLYS